VVARMCRGWRRNVPIWTCRGHGTRCYHADARLCGPFHTMPNIKQQKRRVESAARQRLENVRYRSTAKTIFKRLEQAVQDGDGDRAAQEHRELVKLLDRAAARRAIHPNKAARKKSQAERLLGARS
jgi:small subunit ribosomal protein S20